MKRIFPVVFVLLLACAPAPDPGPGYAARVVGVSDGDTLTVLTAEKRQVKIRLNGVDAPETAQDFGSRAKQAASELAFGKTVTVRVKDKDRYGRTVADVILPDGESLNRAMVARGLAWWYRQYAPDDRDLAELEQEAKAARIGLWSQPNPVPPWEWRHPKVEDHGQVVGNRNSRVYHSPNCSGVARMKASNKVPFASAEKAAAAGYRKAKDCK